MAGSGKYALTLQVDTAGAVTNLDDVKTQLQKTGAGMTALQKAQGPIFGTLNDLTGGLAGKFKDVYESLGAVTKGFGAMKAAIIGTGIGALIILVTELITNFDKYKDTLLGVSSTQKQISVDLENQYEIEQKKLDVAISMDNTLKLQGKSEREIYEIKLKQYDQTIAALEASIEQEESLLRQKKTGEQIILNAAKAAGGKLGGLFGELIFGSKEEQKENEDRIEEHKDKLLALKNTRDGLILGEQKVVKDTGKKIAEDLAQVTSFFKNEHDQRLADITQFYDDLSEKAHGNADLLVQIEKEKQERIRLLDSQISGEKIKAMEAQVESLVSSQNAEIVVRQNYSALALKNEKDQADAELVIKLTTEEAKSAIAKSTYDFLLNLESALIGWKGKHARRDFAISKGIGIAKATVDTYKGVAAAIGSAAPPYNFILAAFTAAAGIAQIAKISKTKYQESGGGGGGSVSAGGGGSMAGGGGGQMDPKTMAAPAIDFSFLNQKGTSGAPVTQAYILPGQISGPMEARQKIKDQSRL